MCERVGEKGNLIPWTWKRVGFLLYGLTLWKWGYIDGGTDVTMKTNRLIPSIYPHPDLTKKKREKRLHQTDGQMPVPNVRTCTFIYGSRDLFFVVGREMNRKIVCQTGQLYTSLPILTLARFSFTGQMTWDPGPEWRPTFSLSRIFLFFFVPLSTHSYIQEPCGCGMAKEMARRKELELKRTCYVP
jgi:hypothetical protein